MARPAAWLREHGAIPWRRHVGLHDVMPGALLARPRSSAATVSLLAPVGGWCWAA